MSGCRIGKVKYKNAPHLAEVVPRVRGAEFRDTMHKHVDQICDYLPTGLAGFAIVAWNFEGGFARGTRIHGDSFVGQTLMPSFVADVLRRDTMRDVADGVWGG